MVFRKHSERFDFVAVLLGRIGFCARGFLWAAIGGVAASAAFTRNKAQGPQGALDVVASNTGGNVILILVTIGIFSYAGWRFFEGLYGLRLDPKGTKWMRFINGYVVPFASFIIYIAFGISNIVTIINGKRNNNSSVISSLGNHTIGKIFLQLAAVILFGVALGWIVMLFQRKFKEGIDREKFDKLPRWAVITIYTLVILGTIGRVILFILLAVLLSRVVWDSSISVGGFGDALGQLQTNVGGKIFLVFIGVLLVLFGLYSCIMSRFKEFLPYKPRLSNSSNMRTLPLEMTEIKKPITTELGKVTLQKHFPFLISKAAK